MDYLNRIKSVLGFSNRNSDQDLIRDGVVSPGNDVRDDIRKTPGEAHPDEFDRFGFNVFTSPLEMHRYFEHQMNEMMKSFGMLGNNDSFFGNSIFGENGEPFFDNNSFRDDFSQFPAIEDFHKQEPGTLREQYLKPGYEQAKPNEENKSDKDLDGKFNIGDWDSIVTGRPSQVQPRTFFFGQSMTSKTICNPDGSVEIHKTVKDPHGNEETTITRKQGDQEYSLTTRVNKDGHQEVIENLVNMEENDKAAFLKGNNRRIKMDGSEKIPPSWFPFNKFF